MVLVFSFPSFSFYFYTHFYHVHFIAIFRSSHSPTPLALSKTTSFPFRRPEHESGVAWGIFQCFQNAWR